MNLNWRRLIRSLVIALISQVLLEIHRSHRESLA